MILFNTLYVGPVQVQPTPQSTLITPSVGFATSAQAAAQIAPENSENLTPQSIVCLPVYTPASPACSILRMVPGTGLLLSSTSRGVGVRQPLLYNTYATQANPGPKTETQF